MKIILKKFKRTFYFRITMATYPEVIIKATSKITIILGLIMMILICQKLMKISLFLQMPIYLCIG